MAFRFRSKSSLTISGRAKATDSNNETTFPKPDGTNRVMPKLTNAQLNKMAKVYPAWIRDNSGLKQLPAIYQGVLGQVQLQPGYSMDNLHKANKQLLANRQQQTDYMNRFTDTERVHQLLSASHLSNDTLATIWAHVNQTFPGKLTNREVCLALALIAIFQRLEKEKVPENEDEASRRDPFSLVKMEKKPPVPTLYPTSPHINNMKTSKSIPDAISSTKTDSLLVDIGEEGDKTNPTFPSAISKREMERKNFDDEFTTLKCINISNAISLIDMDGDRFEMDFYRLIQSWLKLMVAMKVVFKRSFDILNVENSRRSAIEALKHPRGQEFIQQLCLCYPLAHNIKYKIDELDKLRFCTDSNSNKSNNEQKQPQNECLFDKNYTMQNNDLINSINEYWAVLINLFHESGQTKFIEIIMDGLNYKQSTITSETIGELALELNSLNKPNVCSLCHTNFYLTHDDLELKELTMEEIELVSNQEELLSIDEQYYYHAKCANFWLNHVDSVGLPFRKPHLDDTILSPSSNNNN